MIHFDMNNCIDSIVSFWGCIYKPEHHTGFWTMIAALAAFGTLVVAWRQLRKISRVNSAEFIHEFKKDFFVRDTRDLFFLLSHDMLKLHKQNGVTRFEVDKKELEKANIGKDRKMPNNYLEVDIDDLLLGHFEDLGFYEKTGIVDISFVYDSFSEYIATCWKNCEIQKFLATITEYPDTYENFKYIQKKCASYGKAKNANQTMFLWRIRCRIGQWLLS